MTTAPESAPEPQTPANTGESASGTPPAAASGAAAPADPGGAWGAGRISFNDAELHASRFRAAWEVDDEAGDAAAALAPATTSAAVCAIRRNFMV